MVLVLALSSTYSANAQTDVKNTIIKKDPIDKILDLDDELNPTVTATLTGLSLTGASFLMSLARVTSDSESNQIHNIKKISSKLSLCFFYVQ